MKTRELQPPRRFNAGRNGNIWIRHAADVELEEDEQVTFVTASGTEYDVVRKRFGYYATPSLNARLPGHGLRPTLVENADGRRYVLLVERGRERDFSEYLRAEEQRIVEWLDAPARAPCASCGSADLHVRFRYEKPPAGETRFEGAPAEGYRREVTECRACGHFSSCHDMDLAALYSEQYVEATYGAGGLRAAFERITSLPPEQSDNRGRVARIASYLAERGRSPGTVLDIGSGLCVFLARMKEVGWRCTAVDPSHEAARHAREHVGVEAFCGDFMAVEGLARYDLVTLNKVLEHVGDPAGMLRRAGSLLCRGGLVYVEVPDGEMAADEGAEREEFFIEHLAVYSMASLALLARSAGLRVERAERIREPSTKYTLYAFLSLAPEEVA